MKLGTLLLLALPLASLAEWAAHRFFLGCAPTQDDWQRLAPKVASIRRTGDLVTSAPDWTDPLLRQALGQDLVPIELLARADNDSLERVVEVSFGGHRTPEFTGWRELALHPSGPFQIRELANPRLERVRMRLIDRVVPELLEVAEGEHAHRRSCPFLESGRVTAGGLGGDPTFPSRRFACHSGEPYLVAVTTIDDERFRPRRCIWAHPTPRGALSLRFRDVLMGELLVGHAGLPWLISRDGVGTPIHMAARFEGESIGVVTIEDQQGWTRFQWLTHAHRDKRGELELVVSSESPQNRRFCFTLESR